LQYSKGFYIFYGLLKNKQDIMRLFFVVLLYLFPQFLIGNTTHKERSALWVVRYAVTTKSDVDKILSTAIELNISDIFLQIRALGQTYYNSQWEQKATQIKDEFDPLDYIIKRSGDYDLRIHAWVNMFYVWAGDKFPKNKNHILNRRSDYVLRNGDFPDYKSLKLHGHEGFFLDPKVAAVQNDLLNILRELSESYDLDGIHLDYFRYPSLDYSFTPASRTMFMMEDIYDPWIIYQSAQAYTERRGYEVFLYADREYRKSLTNSLSIYLEIISRTIKNIQPDLELSVAVKPDPVEAKHRYFQDWLSWIQNDICDFVAIMNYRTDWQEFDAVLKQLRDRNLNEKIIVGVSTYNQNVVAVIKRIDAIRIGGYAGFSLFSYNYLYENKEYLKNLKRQIMARR
jgi:uncharacterized lipoprotein YddW (UPF0748 family)